MALRIKGLVSAAKKVREQLRTGIPADQLQQVQDYVRGTLINIEQICTQHWTTPDQLPAPSRNAYWYLKNLDLDNLPIAAPGTAVAPAKTIRLRNIRTRQQYFQEQIADLAARNHPKPAHFYSLRQQLQGAVSQVETICAQDQLTPAHLSGAARQVYAWMKFLLLGQHLEAHVQAIQQVRQLVNQMLPADVDDSHQPPAVNPDTVEIEFTMMASVYRYRNSAPQASLQINEAMIFSDQKVLQAIVSTMVKGKQKATNLAIRKYSTSEEFSELLLMLEMQVGEIREQAQGQAYDLDAVFSQVNQTYFQGKMERPRLAWSQGFTHHKLGHYEPARDQVVISLSLDDRQVPDYVVAFIMYHELLHKHHGETWVNGRRMVHTPEFRRDERKFRQYLPAEDWLANSIVP